MFALACGRHGMQGACKTSVVNGQPYNVRHNIHKFWKYQNEVRQCSSIALRLLRGTDAPSYYMRRECCHDSVRASLLQSSHAQFTYHCSHQRAALTVHCHCLRLARHMESLLDLLPTYDPQRTLVGRELVASVGCHIAVRAP